MTTQGIIVIDLIGLLFIIYIIELLRHQKLHISYALLWLLTISGLIVSISIPPFLSIITRLVGALFPVSALSLIAFVFIFMVLISISIQLSTLTSRQIVLIQTFAIKELLEQQTLSSQVDHTQ